MWGFLGKCSTIHFPLHFFVVFFFFWSGDKLVQLIPLFRPGSVHSGSVSLDDCGWVFPHKLCVILFPESFPHYAWTAAWSVHSDFVGSSMYVSLVVTHHLCFWRNARGLLCIRPPLLPGFELTTFWSRAWRSTNKLSWLPVTNQIITPPHPTNTHMCHVYVPHYTSDYLFPPTHTCTHTQTHTHTHHTLNLNVP